MVASVMGHRVGILLGTRGGGRERSSSSSKGRAEGGGGGAHYTGLTEESSAKNWFPALCAASMSLTPVHLAPV
jgi:hypothetical protein